MSKRFTDTEIWRKEWFQKLSPTKKCFLRYVYDNCDNAGVWIVNKSLAEFEIKDTIDWKFKPEDYHGNLIFLSDNKILVTDFILFQYGELKESCVPHRNVFKRLESHGLKYPFHELLIGYQYPIDTLKEKDKEKDKDKDKEEGMQGGKEKTWRNDFDTYLRQCNDAFDALIENWGWIKERKEYHPRLKIRKSAEKMFFDYWGTKEGWKKKKASRTSEIDWPATINKGLTMRMNQVWLQNNEIDEEFEYLKTMERRNAKASG